MVDTNVLLYAANHMAPEHRKCQKLVEGWRQQAAPWHLTWGNVYEFLRVATHPHTLERPFTMRESWRFLKPLLAAPGLEMLVETERHAAVAAEVFAEGKELSGNRVFDTRTAVLMREHGVRRIVTRDTDFHRFPFVEVVDPLAD